MDAYQANGAYPTWYPSGGAPIWGDRSISYPVRGRVGPPVYDPRTGYTTNLVNDPTNDALMDGVNLTQERIFREAANPTLAWYNSSVLPDLQSTYNSAMGVLNGMPPGGAMQPGQHGTATAPAASEGGKDGGNGLLMDVGGFAAAGALAGTAIAPGPGTAIGAGIGAVVGGIKNFFAG